MDWGEILACHAGYYKFSHKHIKPAHTGKLLIDAHNMTHLSGFPNFSNSDRTPLCFHRLTHRTETTLGVLFLYNFTLDSSNHVLGAWQVESNAVNCSPKQWMSLNLVFELLYFFVSPIQIQCVVLYWLIKLCCLISFSKYYNSRTLIIWTFWLSGLEYLDVTLKNWND